MTDASLSAITIYQPFASMIAAGCKPFEFRKWRADSFVGKRIVIHASVKKVDAASIWGMANTLREGHESFGLKRWDALEFLERIKARMLAREPMGLPLGAGLGTVRLGVPRRVADIYAPDFGIDLSGVRPDLFGWPLEVFQPFAEPVRDVSLGDPIHKGYGK